MQQDTPASCPYHSLSEAYNPRSAAQVTDPYTLLKRAREEEPIFFSPSLNAWIVSRYEDVSAIIKDTKRFSSAYASKLKANYTPEALAILAQTRAPKSILMNDGAEHMRGRKPLSRAFSARRVAMLEPQVRTLVNQLISNLPQSGEIDLIQQFTTPLSYGVISSLLNIPEVDKEQVTAWAKAFLAISYGNLQREQQVEFARSSIALENYLFQLMEQRREHPEDDFISDLLRSVKEEQVDLRDGEVLELIRALIVAGAETTANSLGGGLSRLLTQREHWEALQQHPETVPAVVEEILRYEGVFGVFRLTTEEVTIRDITIPPDTLIYISLSSSNHDEAAFTQADTFLAPRENTPPHLAFGYGVHFCVGAPLARLEMRVALEILPRRIPSLRIASGEDVVRYLPTATLGRSMQRLQAEYDVVLPTAE